jgi:hypothetical protein
MFSILPALGCHSSQNYCLTTTIETCSQPEQKLCQLQKKAKPKEKIQTTKQYTQQLNLKPLKQWWPAERLARSQKP